MPVRALWLAVVLVGVLAVYDVAQALNVRCVRAADRNSVAMLDELDALPGVADFKIDAIKAGGHFSVPQKFVRIQKGTGITLRGSAGGAWMSGLPGVIALIDGMLRVSAERDGGGPQFRIVLPKAVLPLGLHRVSFVVVKSDLSGYTVPRTDVRVEVVP